MWIYTFPKCYGNSNGLLRHKGLPTATFATIDLIANSNPMNPRDQIVRWLFGGVILFYAQANRKIVFQDAAPVNMHALAVNETFDTIYAAGHHKLVAWGLTSDS